MVSLNSRLSAALLVMGVLFAAVAPAQAGRGILRVTVHKTRTVTGNPPIIVFTRALSPSLAAAGAMLRADYGSHTLYEVPSGAAESLVAQLERQGITAEIATELDDVRFQEYRIDPDSGAITPPLDLGAGLPGGRDGLYILVFKGYPTEEWKERLRSRNIRILEEVPPASYLVRGEQAVMTTIAGALPEIRGVFPLHPAMKKTLFRPAETPGSHRPVAVTAVEETVADRILPYLQTVSDGSLHVRRKATRARYAGRLTDIDIEVLSHMGNVYSLTLLQDRLEPSAERQGQLVLNPCIADSPCGPPSNSPQLTLPTAAADYWGALQSKGISDFSNTRVGVLDTGFHDGTPSHPDFVPGSLEVLARPVWGGDAKDYNLHGTIVTSIISALTPSTAGKVDAQSYHLSLGLAPGVHVVTHKIVQCNGFAGPGFLGAFNEIDPYDIDVVNISYNTFGANGGCNYTGESEEVDDATRDRDWLFTISAGNLPEGDGICSYVRSPGTAKNALTIGATMNYTPDPPLNWANLDIANTCAWNAASADARDIPSYSVQRNPQGVIKPDLVAPGTRVTGPVAEPPSSCPPPASPLGAFCNNALSQSPDGVSYGHSAGTSFSAPAAAGAAAVVRKWYANINASNPSPAITKAMLINGARDLGPRPGIAGGRVLSANMTTVANIGHVPDPYQGWGMLSLERLLGPRDNYYSYDQRSSLTGPPAWQKYLYVVDGAKDLRVTLVWTDAPSTVSSDGKYSNVNNLNLTVTRASGGSSWYGNRFNVSTGYSAVNLPKADKVNNVEQVFVQGGTLATGEAIIALVDPFNVTSGSQDFALFIDNANEPPTLLTTVTPCRLVDTRNPFGPYGGPAIPAYGARIFAVGNQCGVPVTARAVALNVTVFNPTTAGSLRLYPAGIAPPSAETILYGAGQVLANNGVIALAPGGDLMVRCDQPSGSADAIIDIVGYFQ